MFFDIALAWPVILALCAFVLFVKASLLIRALIVTRQTAWKYLLVLLPLIVSAWSFIVATNSLQVYSDLPFPGVKAPACMHGDETPAIASCISGCVCSHENSSVAHVTTQSCFSGFQSKTLLWGKARAYHCQGTPRCAA